jgi:DNA replication and repair protein RecF
MILTRLEVEGLRNLSCCVEFGVGRNILVGENAQGKTGLLEAIYLLANTKSFRTSNLRDVISFGAEEAAITGEVERAGIRRRLELRLSAVRKDLVVNGKRVETAEYLPCLDALVYSLEAMDVVRGEPSERRRFLDRGVLTLRPAYLRTLADYNRALKQKNRLLREAASDTADPVAMRGLIEVWNDQLVTAGARIHRARAEYVERLAAALRSDLFPEPVTLRYRSALEAHGDLGDYEGLFRHRLEVRADAEQAAGHALIGPPRDELEVLAGDRDVGRYGSAGQQRSALLILDLAQLSVYYDVFAEYPVLLIDDIDSELDRGRIDRLLGHLEGKAQAIISTSKQAVAEAYADRAAVFAVSAGRATPR